MLKPRDEKEHDLLENQKTSCYDEIKRYRAPLRRAMWESDKHFGSEPVIFRKSHYISRGDQTKVKDLLRADREWNLVVEHFHSLIQIS